MRGAPQKGFARLISRISCRTSRGTLGCRVVVATSSARRCGTPCPTCRSRGHEPVLRIRDGRT